MLSKSTIPHNRIAILEISKQKLSITLYDAKDITIYDRR